MILVDSRIGSKELIPYIQRMGAKVQQSQLEFGDACFEGNGQDGRICIGIERKALSDMINCINDARYSAHQRPGMLSMYNHSILMVEGVWKPDTASGYMLELVRGISWRPFQRERYHKLFRYLLTLQFSGTCVIITRDIEHTAYNICECFHYFQKKWEDHTSLMETQKLNIPELRGKPSLVRRWASDLEGVGVKLSMEAEKVFKTPFELAEADESKWMQIEGISAKLARKITKSIRGW